MIKSMYWALLQTSPETVYTGSVLRLHDVTILELTEDGLAFLWPERPNLEDLCAYCQRFPAKIGSPGCKAPEHHNYPCNFLEDPSSEHQDITSYMMEGKSEFAGGYFSGLRDFLSCHGYPEESVHAVDLGSYSSIIAAREAWHRICALHASTY